MPAGGGWLVGGQLRPSFVPLRWGSHVTEALRTARTVVPCCHPRQHGVSVVYLAVPTHTPPRGGMPVAALVLLGALASAAVAQDAERLLQQHAELMRASEQALQQHAAAATYVDSDLSEDSDPAFNLLYRTVAAARNLDFEEAARLAGKSAQVRSAAVGGATVHRQLQLLRRLASASRAGDFGTAASLLGELKQERGHLKLVPELIMLADVWLGWDIGRDHGHEAAAAAAAAAKTAAAAAVAAAKKGGTTAAAAVAAAKKGGTAAETATAAAAMAAATTAVAAAEAATAAAKEAAAEEAAAEEAAREAETEAARKAVAEKEAEKEAEEAREHLLKEVAIDAEMAALEAENARLMQALSTTVAKTLTLTLTPTPTLTPTLTLTLNPHPNPNPHPYPHPKQALETTVAKRLALERGAASRSAARPASAEAVAEEQAVEEAMAAEAAEVRRQAAEVAEAVAEAQAEAQAELTEAERQAVAVDANGAVTLPSLSPLSPPPPTPGQPAAGEGGGVGGGGVSQNAGGSQASRNWWRKFRQAEAAAEARQPGYVLTDEERRAEMIAVSVPMGAAPC